MLVELLLNKLHLILILQLSVRYNNLKVALAIFINLAIVVLLKLRPNDWLLFRKLLRNRQLTLRLLKLDVMVHLGLVGICLACILLFGGNSWRGGILPFWILFILLFFEDLEGIRNVETRVDHYQVSVIWVALHLCAIILWVNKHNSAVSFGMIHFNFNRTIIRNQSFSRLVTFLIENSKIVPNNRVIRLQRLSFYDRVKRPSIIPLLIKQDGLRDQVDLLRWRLLYRKVIVFKSFRKFVEAVVASCLDVERVSIIFLSLFSFWNPIKSSLNVLVLQIAPS